MSTNGVAVLIAAVLLAGCLVVFYPSIENLFIFYPDPHFETTPADWNLEYEDVTFHTEDRIPLHGWFFPTEGDPPVILFSHGNAGNISHRLPNVRRLVERGFSVFIYDYRGYGKSKGSPSEAGLYLDGLAAYDVLVGQKNVAPERIALFGRSLGAAVALAVALERKAGCVILESAFTSTRAMAKSIILFRPISPLLPAHYNNVQKIAQVTAPKLIIHGEADEIVPFSMGKELYEAAAKPKSFFPVEGAGHNDTFIAGGDRYFDVLSHFIKNQG